MTTRSYYPLFVNLEGQTVVVIGGGAVASKKVSVLLRYGARVTVVAPTLDAEIAALASEGRISWRQRAFEPGDLAGARLAICACGVPAVDKTVALEARACGCLLNVVDEPELCDFIVPATVSRGPLQIAISTAGTAPLEARRIKNELAEAYDESWEPYLLLLGEVRGLVKAHVPGDESRRKPLFEALAASDVHSRIAAGEALTAEQVYGAYIAPLVGEPSSTAIGVAGAGDEVDTKRGAGECA